ncbi:MAG TPA: LuxR C-terminal-related transcriptional regulator [Ktedonobacterales bacterium]
MAASAALQRPGTLTMAQPGAQPGAQPDTWTAASFQPDPEWVAAGLARLAPLLPAAPSAAAAHDLPARALAYIARYGRDVPHLEYEWELLYAAQVLAARRGAHASVARLAVALARIAGRLRDRTAAERMLQLGIGASRRLQDRRRLALLLNRLGGLLCAHGQFERGARLWYTSLGLAESPALGLWEPLRGFAVTADVIRGTAAADRFVASLQESHGEGRAACCPDALAVALFVRGLHSRTSGAPARAADDFATCLRLLTRPLPTAQPDADRQLLLFAAQAELARAHDDYPRAHAYTTTALALARLYGDRYALAALLVDQTIFAHEHGQFDDAHAALVELRATLDLMGTPQFYERTRLYLESAVGGDAGSASPSSGPLALPPGDLMPPPQPLSPREREVLRLVAAGLSNQETAVRLVVTTGTVKKHLEHIYTKLDASSRTAAVAQARQLRLI